MKFSIKKKTILLSLSILFLLVCVGGFSVIAFLAPKDIPFEEKGYDLLLGLEKVEKKETLLEGVYSFDVLVTGEYVDSNGDVCIKLFLPRLDQYRGYLDVCENRKIVKWVNPYVDYSNAVPARMILTSTFDILKMQYVISGVEVVGLSDSEYENMKKFLEEKGIFEVSTWNQERGLLARRGYSLVKTLDSVSALYFEKVRILASSSKNFGITLEIFVDGKYYSVEYFGAYELFSQKNNEKLYVDLEDIVGKYCTLVIENVSIKYDLESFVSGIVEIGSISEEYKITLSVDDV